MATKETGWPAPPASTPGPPPGGVPGHVARAAGPFSGRRGPGVAWLGERTQAAVEKRGPYMVMRMPSIQAKLQKHRDLAKSVLRRKGMLGASPNRPDSSGKRLVKFNKGYTALSQSPDENLVSFNSDSDGELESRYSSGYSSAEVNQDVSRQLLQDGYHLDEIPDDEDLDLIPPKPMASSTCSCSWCCLGDSFSCTLQ
ncbi:protein FAM219B isoform X3 [Artibeus jamaicensis]|uniref:protein FAM219B isoform X3 n=1 Tax=Artibeus jamaicensis TaxID=9417 RepID=UPI00235A4DE4|nr:protein FAM219B isoform X3 [Artibeus jamaicensis]